MKLSICTSLEQIEASEWDALAGDHQPFLEHAFLYLLETSRSVGPEAGWLPHHLLLRDEGRLVGACPNYIKDNSRGEYIFDWGWAEASMAAGIPYYPKFLVGVPFTPATGPRFLVHPEHRDQPIREGLANGLIELCSEMNINSVHILFCTEEEARSLGETDYAHRLTHQYHWFNEGYADFDEFLSHFRSRARKQVRKERRRVAEQDLFIERRMGRETQAGDWRQFYELYRSTYARKWGSPYLTEAFFQGIPECLGDRALLVTAKEDDTIAAASLSFQKGENLYGRYWGANRAYDCLHFELCYYQLIEHAIQNGIMRVEAGAQGEHKVKRGFVPRAIHSLHHLKHPQIHGAVEDFVEREARRTKHILQLIAEHSPYRRPE